jgi:type I restriction enzyme M protein
MKLRGEVSNLKSSLVVDYHSKLDPSNDFIEIDVSKRKITYKVRNTYIANFDDEEFVRAYYVTKLIASNGFKKEDLVVEEEHTFPIGRGKKDIAIDIALYKEDKPIIIFELKSPSCFDPERYKAIRTQLYAIADNLTEAENLDWLVYATVQADTLLEEDVITIDYKRYPSYKEWKKSNERSFSQIPDSTSRFAENLVKGKVALKPLYKQSIIKLKRRLHNTLWRGGTRGDNKVFFNLLKMIICKVYDEQETHNDSSYTFQLKYSGDKIDYAATATTIQNLYQRTLENKNYLDFSPTKLQELAKVEKGVEIIELTDEEIAFVVTEFQNYALTITDYDALAIFFEMILREGYKQSVGSYFTHTNLVTFLVYAIELDELSKKKIRMEETLPYIVDTCAGSGTFLIEAMRTITKTVIQHKNQLIANETIRRLILAGFDDNLKVHPWAKEYIYGVDRNPHLLLTTKVNMIMHGDGHIHVYPDDALNDFDQYADMGIFSHQKSIEVYGGKVNERFDVILSNPPFSMEIDERAKERYGETFPLLGGGKGSEILFIERWYQLLKPKGRLGVVLPESIFDTTENLDVRIFLYRYFWVKAIVSIPGTMKKGAFAPYTDTKTSLLLCQKKEASEVKQWDAIWETNLYKFLKLKNELKKYFGNKRTKQNVIPQYQIEKETFVNLLREYLDDWFSEYDSGLSVTELVNKYADDFWSVERDGWIFKRASIEIVKIYPATKTATFITHIDGIGYKRTKRREDVIENRLFKKSRSGEVVINVNNPETVLDYLRKEVIWE